MRADSLARLNKLDVLDLSNNNLAGNVRLKLCEVMFDDQQPIVQMLGFK